MSRSTRRAPHDWMTTSGTVRSMSCLEPGRSAPWPGRSTMAVAPERSAIPAMAGSRSSEPHARKAHDDACAPMGAIRTARHPSCRRSGTARSPGHRTSTCRSPHAKRSPSRATSGRSPCEAIRTASTAPAPSRSHRWSARMDGTMTRPTVKARMTSGSADTRARVRSVRISASIVRMPRAASAGTMRRDPAFPSDMLPASTSTVLDPQATTWHAPSPSSSVVTTSEPPRRSSACGRAAPNQRSTARTPRIAQQPRRARPVVARHASTVVPSAATVHQRAGLPVHQMAPGRSSDPTATSSSARAHAAAVAPQAACAASDRGAVAAAQTPAMVVNAASGIVSTLSAAAHPLAVPACARAIGVLTVQATTEETTAAAAASAT